MALDKQIVREYGTYAELTTGSGAKELQLYMIGLATDIDMLIHRSDDGYHKILDTGATTLAQHAIPFTDANGHMSQSVTNLKYETSLNKLTATNIACVALTASGAITGNSFVTAQNIGIAADTDLIQLTANVLKVNGSVGIGVSDPNCLLEIWDDDADPILTITAAHATDYDPQIRFRTDVSDTTKFTLGVDGADDKFKIFSGQGIGGTTEFVIDTSGNVGIGTATPAALLEVRKDQNALTVARIKNDTGGTGAYAGLYVGSNSATGYLYAFDDGYTTILEYADKIVLRGATNALATAISSEAVAGEVQIYVGGTASGNKKAVYSTTDLTLSNGIGLNLYEDITFLGATTENQVKIPDNLADALSFKEGANFYQTFITTNGSEAIQFHKNVGIGTATPLLNIGTATGDLSNSGGLHVKSDVASNDMAYVIIEGDSHHPNGGAHGAGGLIFADNGGAANDKIIEMKLNEGGTGTQDLQIRALNDDLTLKNLILYLEGINGRVGIGKAATAYKLEIDLATDDFALEDAEDDDTTIGVHVGYVDIVLGSTSLRLKAYERAP